MRIYLNFCLFSTLCFLISNSACQKEENNTDSQESFNVITTYSKSNFPLIWRPVMFGNQIDDYNDLTYNMEVFISIYEPNFLNKYIDNIYVIKDLRNVLGQEFGGTVNNKNIYANDFNLNSVLHHELSHIYHNENKELFPEEEWLQINGNNFSYSGSGMQYILFGSESENGISLDSLHSLGFLNQYSTSSIDEDIAVFCEMLHSDYQKRQETLEIINSNQKLKQKYSLLSEFFLRIGLKTSFTSFK